MTVTTNTLGANSAEIVIVGPEDYRNVAAAVQSFITTKGWNIVPDSTFSTTVTVSTSGTNIYTATSTSGLVIGMPITFSGSTFGGVSPATVYYVFSIPSSTEFTVSTTSPIQNPATAAVLVLGSATGTMTVTSSLAGLSNNSTNSRQRVYWAYNLTGSIYKYIRLNLIDLTVDTAMVYTATTTGGQTFYTGTNEAYRFNHFQHVNYPRDYYINNTTTPTSTGTVASNTTPSFAVSTVTGIATNSNFFNGSNTNSTAFTSTQGWPFYPGQPIISYSVGSGNYAYGTVSSWSENTGTLVMGGIDFATTSGANRTDWVLLYPGVLNYNNSLNPAYVYISCSARHFTIQTRHTDGTWNDWIAITEYENPLGLSAASLSTTAAASWGLTTGYMSGNSGYVFATTASSGLLPTNIGGSPQNITSASGSTNSNTTWAGWIRNNVGSITTSINLNNPPTFTSSMRYYGKWVQYVGPISSPYTYKGRSGNYASQTAKMITPLGEAGFIGSLRRKIFQGSYRSTGDSLYMFQDELAQAFFKGMADVMPTAANNAAGTKHFAVTPSVNIDYGNETNYANFAAASLLDSYNGNTYNIADNTPTGWFSSYRNNSQYTTTQPTPMGRLYNIKYVTTTLSSLNTISIKVDSSGFVSSSGSTTDHLIFCYPSYYQSPDVNTNIGNTQAKSTNSSQEFETGLTQNTIRNSQSVSVAFPK